MRDPQLGGRPTARVMDAEQHASILAQPACLSCMLGRAVLHGAERERGMKTASARTRNRPWLTHLVQHSDALAPDRQHGQREEGQAGSQRQQQPL